MSVRLTRSAHRRFAVGDRVAFITRDGTPVGRVGTVVRVEGDMPYAVQWDGVDYRVAKLIHYDPTDLVWEWEYRQAAER